MGEYAAANTPPSCSLYFKYNRAMRFHSDSSFNPLNGSLLHFMAALACLALVFVTGATSLQSDPIFNDELNSLNRVLVPTFNETRTIPETIELLAQLSPEHPPSYFVLLHLWTKITGSDLMTIRLLSLYFGLLALAFAYRLALVTQDHDTAAIAIFLTTFLAFFLAYTRVARMYSLLPLISAWLAWSYWRVRSPANHVRRRNWLSLFASAATILYVHYFGIMTLMAIGAYHLLISRKDKRWIQISVVVLAAGLLFLPWLPVVATDDLVKMAVDRLSLIESTRVIVSIYSNGGFALLLLAAVASLRVFKRFNSAQKYLLIVALLHVMWFLIVNEFAAIIVARRMRYTLVFSVIWCCAFAVALGVIPFWKYLRIPIAILWVFSFYSYSGSHDIFVFRNLQALRTHKVPDFQRFQYDPAIVPIFRDSILVLHPDETMPRAPIKYYINFLSDWQNFLFMKYNEHGEIDIDTLDLRLTQLTAIVERNQGLWVVYNPQFTKPETMSIYTNWLAREFQPCRRFFENHRTVIQYFVKRPIPCDLFIGISPLQVQYDNGTHLENAVTQLEDEQVTSFLWWSEMIDGAYAVSLQIFDHLDNKRQQFDGVIGSDPIDAFPLDVTGLEPGRYSVKMILYDVESSKSQSGTVVATDGRFERAIEIASIFIGL